MKHQPMKRFASTPWYTENNQSRPNNAQNIMLNALPNALSNIIELMRIYRGRRVLVCGAGRALFVFGDKTCGATSTFFEAALVARAGRVVAGAAVVVVAVVVGALTLFAILSFGSGRPISPLFSLSSPDISSLVLFTPRVGLATTVLAVVVVCLAVVVVFEVTRLGAGADADTGAARGAGAAAGGAV